jgi:hypothetical protein
MTATSSLAHVALIAAQYSANASSLIAGGRLKLTVTYAGGMPLVQQSEASRCAASRAEAAGPMHGITESGSVVIAITRPAPARTIAQSPPTRGPTSTSARAAPSAGAIVSAKTAGEILPSAALLPVLPDPDSVESPSGGTAAVWPLNNGLANT